MEDLLLDTGCSQTLVRQEVVPDEKLTNRQVSIHCAHGDILEYPVADVRIRICDKEFTVKAGVSDRLPRSVLLGTDIPAWRELLNGALADDGGCPNALVVTRSQRTAMEKAETERMEKEAASGAKPSSVEDETEGDPCEEGVDSGLIGTEFDDELFTKYPDKSTSPGDEFETLNFTSAEMERQQQEDPTLVAI